MARPKTAGPTDRELMILRVLWENGPCTVRDVHEELKKELDVGYTSILKVMQIMFDKGLVVRDESRHSHIYEAAHSRDDTETEMVTHLLGKVFGGSAMKLVTRALSTQRTSDEELAELKQLIEKLEEDKL